MTVKSGVEYVLTHDVYLTYCQRWTSLVEYEKHRKKFLHTEIMSAR